ncbi:hypothetical protein Tco_1235042 [Tanacetum coccineum]
MWCTCLVYPHMELIPPHIYEEFDIRENRCIVADGAHLSTISRHTSGSSKNDSASLPREEESGFAPTTPSSTKGSKRMGSQLVSEKPKKNKPSVGPISSFVAPRPLLVDLVANVGQKEAGSSKGSPRVLHRAMLAPSAKESGPSADANLRPPVKRKYLQPPMREPNFKKVATEPLVEDGVVGAKPDSSSRGSDAESFFDDPLVCRDIVDKWAPSATMQRFSLMSNDEFVAEYEKWMF